MNSRCHGPFKIWWLVSQTFERISAVGRTSQTHTLLNTSVLHTTIQAVRVEEGLGFDHEKHNTVETSRMWPSGVVNPHSWHRSFAPSSRAGMSTIALYTLVQIYCLLIETETQEWNAKIKREQLIAMGFSWAHSILLLQMQVKNNFCERVHVYNFSRYIVAPLATSFRNGW